MTQLKRPTGPEWLVEKNRRFSRNFDEVKDDAHSVLSAWTNEPQYVNALEMAYRKWVLEDDSVGTSELEDALADALNEAMGPTAFMRWLAEITDDYGGPEYVG